MQTKRLSPLWGLAILVLWPLKFGIAVYSDTFHNPLLTPWFVVDILSSLLLALALVYYVWNSEAQMKQMKVVGDQEPDPDKAEVKGRIWVLLSTAVLFGAGLVFSILKYQYRNEPDVVWSQTYQFVPYLNWLIGILFLGVCLMFFISHARQFNSLVPHRHRLAHLGVYGAVLQFTGLLGLYIFLSQRAINRLLDHPGQ